LRENPKRVVGPQQNRRWYSTACDTMSGESEDARSTYRPEGTQETAEEIAAAARSEASLIGLACRWCGSDVPSRTVYFCAECKSPIRLLGHIIFSLNFATKNLLLPLVIGIVTFLLATYQQKISLKVDDSRKLADAYANVGKIQSELRRDQSSIQLLMNGSSSTVSANALKNAVLDYDEKFDLYEPSLAPFEEVETRTQNISQSGGFNIPDMANVWRLCFLIPYYGNRVHPEFSYWNDIRSQLANCSDTSCPIAAANGINTIMSKIYSGTCACTTSTGPVQMPMEWFWRKMRALTDRRIMELPPHFNTESRALKPNKDLTKQQDLPICPPSFDKVSGSETAR
jgi:hypothetical protein